MLLYLVHSIAKAKSQYVVYKLLNNNKKVKNAPCEESERKARVEKVAAILKDLKYKTESDRLQAVLSFSRSSLSESEIDMLCKPLRPDYMVGQEFRKGVF